MSDYDSRPTTRDHIRRVRELLAEVEADLWARACVHDASKLNEPELSIFDEFSPKLRDTTYGSEEYKSYLTAMGEGLAHHYKANRHHPEHWPNGIRDMNLIDLIEMLADWKAASSGLTGPNTYLSHPMRTSGTTRWMVGK